MKEIARQLAAAVRAAADAKRPLCIRGGGSKDFYGHPVSGEPLDTRAFAGIVSYEPTELVVTARAGTPLAELEAALAERGQMLPFEPPRFGPAATLGGCVAAGLSGPRRASAGAVRDFVLGVRLLDGRGRDLRFGGEVMKNVAGYDLPRLMAGALGTLGVLLEVSLKVLPRPAAEATLRFALDERGAIESLNRWAGMPLPLSASCWHDGALLLRLSGSEAALRAARARLGGDAVDGGAAFWESLREQTHPYFAGPEALWRLSLKSTTPPLALPGRQLIEWGGSLRWLRSAAPAAAVREAAARAAGHATLFRGGDRAAGVFHPLPAALMTIHRRLKEAFDPAGVFNPGRMYPDL